MTQSCRYNCAANYLEAEKAVKLLSQFCKGRTQQAARLKLHSACIGCGACQEICPAPEKAMTIHEIEKQILLEN